jgi:hypothetical protein
VKRQVGFRDIAETYGGDLMHLSFREPTNAHSRLDRRFCGSVWITRDAQLSRAQDLQEKIELFFFVF